MAELAARTLLNVAALWVADQLLGGMAFSGRPALIAAAAVLAVANWLVKPVLAILALPLIILTLGLGYFLVTVTVLALTAWVVPGFTLDGFWTAAWATIVVWLVNTILGAVMGVGNRGAAAAGRRGA